MKFQVDSHFRIRVSDRLIGYTGEMNSRYIDAEYVPVEGAERYVLRMDYGGGQVYELPLTGDCTKLPASLLGTAGTVRCQFCALKAEGDTYTLIRKTEVFEGYVRQGIGSGEEIPAYEMSVTAFSAIEHSQAAAEASALRAESARDSVVINVSQMTQSVEQSAQSAQAAANTKAAVEALLASAESTVTAAQSSADTAEAAASEAESAAAAAAESASAAMAAAGEFSEQNSLHQISTVNRTGQASIIITQTSDGSPFELEEALIRFTSFTCSTTARVIRINGLTAGEFRGSAPGIVRIFKMAGRWAVQYHMPGSDYAAGT